MRKLTIITFLVFLVPFQILNAKDKDKNTVREFTPNKVAVVWTSGDPEVAEKMCFMYTHAAKANGWFDEVVLIIWGPSAKLLTENKMLQDKVKEMQKDGVDVKACIVCAGMYGVVETLEGYGIQVEGMGVALTDYLKAEDWCVISF
jgi:hypothetical protein